MNLIFFTHISSIQGLKWFIFSFENLCLKLIINAQVKNTYNLIISFKVLTNYNVDIVLNKSSENIWNKQLDKNGICGNELKITQMISNFDQKSILSQKEYH